MFNLFKKSNGNQVAVLEKVDLKNKTTNEIIEEIHESFFTEVDKLLAEANISKSNDTTKQELIDKCNRLKALGFTNTKEVKEAELEINRLEKIRIENESKKKLIEAINYFSFKYPNYKFITEESVKKICRKYGLVYGDIKNYLGTVPDKNLVQMEQFKIDENDELYERFMFDGFFGKHSFGFCSKKTRDSYYRSKEQISDDKDIGRYIQISRYRSDLIIVKCQLEIAAPMKDFNMSNMEVKDFKVTKIEIPDPVVLKPVLFNDQKFYLIVTAWGIEASDVDVVNEKMN